MKKQTSLLKNIVKVSFMLYLMLLTWIIVFKFRFHISDLKYIRSINLIPFKANVTKEILINVILFIPLGMYLKRTLDNKFLNILLIVLISFIFEALQYILHIGVSDITDIIMNTLGGIIGISIISISSLIFNNNKFINKLFDFLLITMPVFMILLLFLI